MPLTFANGENDVFDKLKTIPGIDVMQGEYVQDSYEPERDANGMFVPYVLLKYNGAFPHADNGIVGPEKDTQRVSFSVYIVSPDERNSREIRDQVRVLMLTDFQPTDGSSLRPAGSLSFIGAGLGGDRYVANLSFSYLANLS